MGIAPLFVRYQTQSGNYYVYDVGTNEIIRVGRVIYEILGSVGVLDEAELIKKYHYLGERHVRDALARLDVQQSQGILHDTGPQVSVKADRVYCQGMDQSFGSFLRDHSRLLTLELTQECNLRCEYCCYGDHYPQLRNYSKVTMSLETAKSAIEHYLSRRPQKCRVGFYGGEPLLELELLKEIVLFAEEHARRCGLEAEFNMTTNGTLLTDEIIHFLAKHRFNVLISLDGPKEVHDRYRVFRNGRHPEDRRGSYDVVMNAVERFAELYPDYPGRGVVVTLTATSDIEAIDNLLASLAPSYSLVIASLVRDLPSNSKGDGKDAAFRYGCWATLPCQGGGCGKEWRSSEQDLQGSGVFAHLPVAPEMSKSQDLPDFCNWTKESTNRYRSGMQRFNRELSQNADDEVVQTHCPVSRSMFLANAKSLHHRGITSRPLPANFAYRCFPGSTRTFCSAGGDLYPCERTEAGEVFRLGTADSGVSTDRALRLAEVCRLLSDCGNCVAKRLCPLCAAAVSEEKDSERADALAFRKSCQSIVENLPMQLSAYTAIMETCPDREAVDKIVTKGPDDDWVESLQFLVTEEQMTKDVDLELEELEETV